ncbi:Ornithine carbamoyltransferase [Giardia duodenalis]|uniref:ornithine carbamoyltransferase n=1 Tax=Giardia intestinalis TaxID=5741 RepID=V6TR69_GIAIN|nr:Ornithine carbamoyltransferase [Giardia intestinalis]
MPFKQTRHLLTISALSPKELMYLVDRALDMKKNPTKYTARAANKTLLAFFAKPSLRTRVSLETAMTRLGGHAIYYELGANSNVGGKETVQDTAEVFSRMVDICTARLATKEMMREMAQHASVPCINALDDFGHPLQMVCDFMTIKEKFSAAGEFSNGFKGIKFAYCGDSMNNVTYDLMRGCALLGMECHVCCPDHKDFKPIKEVIDECEEIIAKHSTGGSIEIFHDCKKGCEGVDVVYTDSWMSYHITKEQKEARLKILTPFQVDDAVMAVTSKRSVFMNCLPATRGEEQTASVIDGPKSICYDEAGNRLHSAMAVLDFFLHDCKME